MKSICASLEDKIVSVLQSAEVVGYLEIPIVGLLQVAGSGEVKREDLTSIQVRVSDVQQPHEALALWQARVEIKLNVEQAESANGVLFREAFEAIATWIERTMISENCTELDTEEVNVDGLQLGGGDSDYDGASGLWFANWNLTLSGRLKIQK